MQSLLASGAVAPGGAGGRVPGAAHAVLAACVVAAEAAAAADAGTGDSHPGPDNWSWVGGGIVYPAGPAATADAAEAVGAAEVAATAVGVLHASLPPPPPQPGDADAAVAVAGISRAGPPPPPRIAPRHSLRTSRHHVHDKHRRARGLAPRGDDAHRQGGDGAGGGPRGSGGRGGGCSA